MFNCVLDGELLSQDQSDKAEDTFRDTAGKVGSKGEKTGLIFNVFDTLIDKEFFSDMTSRKYSERRSELMVCFEHFTAVFFKFIHARVRTVICG